MRRRRWWCGVVVEVAAHHLEHVLARLGFQFLLLLARELDRHFRRHRLHRVVDVRLHEHPPAVRRRRRAARRVGRRAELDQLRDVKLRRLRPRAVAVEPRGLEPLVSDLGERQVVHREEDVARIVEDLEVDAVGERRQVHRQRELDVHRRVERHRILGSAQRLRAGEADADVHLRRCGARCERCAREVKRER